MSGKANHFRETSDMTSLLLHWMAEVIQSVMCAFLLSSCLLETANNIIKDQGSKTISDAAIFNVKLISAVF